MRAQKVILQSSVLLILLLLYETWSLPFPYADDWTISTREEAQESQIPVWARKAGFRVRKKQTVKETETENGNEKDEKVLITTDKPSLIPFISESLDHSGTQIIDETTTAPEKKHRVKGKGNKGKKKEIQEEPEPEILLEDSSEEDLLVEEECPDIQFWHIRGRRCVPLECPGGNKWRDVDTGECMLRRFKGRGRAGRRWKKKYSTQFTVPARGSTTGLVNSHWSHG